MQYKSPPAIPDKRARPHTTILGRVVWNRAKHEFSDKDVYRIVRALTKQEDEINIGPWLGTLILELVRMMMTYIKETAKIKEFLLGLIFKFLPEFLKILISYEDEYWKFLKALWIWIGDILADANEKPPGVKPKT